MLVIVQNQPDCLADDAKLPWLVGQKFERLLQIVSKAGPAHDHHIADRIERLRPYHELRTMLGHGVMTTSISPDGTWVVHLETADCKTGLLRVRRLSLTAAEAVGYAELLAKLCQDLSSASGQLRKKLGRPNFPPMIEPVCLPSL